MKGLIAWFAQTEWLRTLLMITVVMAGAITLPDLKKEVFPEFAVGVISVSVSYRGAAPEEVEEAVCIRVEEALQGLEGIDRVLSTANEGMGTVRIEIEAGYDSRMVLDEVKARVDAIDTFSGGNRETRDRGGQNPKPGDLRFHLGGCRRADPEKAR